MATYLSDTTQRAHIDAFTTAKWYNGIVQVPHVPYVPNPADYQDIIDSQLKKPVTKNLKLVSKTRRNPFVRRKRSVKI